MQAIEPWYSVEDIARHMGVSKETIHRWLKRRNIPAHRMGKLWKFKPSEVDAWVIVGGAEDDSNQKGLSSANSNMGAASSRASGERLGSTDRSQD